MGEVLSDLHNSPYHPDDPVLPFVYWMTLEPLIAFDAGHALEFYENAKDKNKTERPMRINVILWFDSEDYLLPADDDATRRLCELLIEPGNHHQPNCEKQFSEVPI